MANRLRGTSKFLCFVVMLALVKLGIHDTTGIFVFPTESRYWLFGNGGTVLPICSPMVRSVFEQHII